MRNASIKTDSRSFCGRKSAGMNEPAVLAEYRLNCVCQAQEYAKCLLKANHQRERADLYANRRHTRSKPLRLKGVSLELVNER